MAERRLLSKKITDCDSFVEMGAAAQALYFHLNMGADDDGFNNQIQMAMYKAHASMDDLKILVLKNFLIKFENGVYVIKDWRVHNTIRKDRYNPTSFQNEFKLLELNDDNTYSFSSQMRLDLDFEDGKNDYGNQMATKWHPSGTPSKDKLSKDKLIINSNINITSAEQSKDSSSVFIKLPLNTGENYSIYNEDVSKYKQIYPGVNVEQELRNMFGWLDSNPKNRKTKNGIKSFITRWLNKRQDQSSNKTNETNQSFSNEKYRTSGFDKL